MNNLEEKFGIESKQAFALLAVIVLNVLWIVCNTYTHIQKFGGLNAYQVVNIVMFAVAVFYACYGYKKPHGNLMRYLMLCCVVLDVILYINSRLTYPPYMIYVFYAITILKAYMAGRLDHYKQNVIISAIIFALQIIHICPNISRFVQENTMSFVNFFRSIGPVTVWLAIAAGYIIRFKPHKEAGLADKE